MDVLFPQVNPDECRVCREEVVDGRWNYCSTRCKDIARAVQKMFIWEVVREQILERDDYTCRTCGYSTEAEQNSERDLHVDHIEPLAEGGHPFDEENLQTLCEACHHQKTAEQNRTTRESQSITLEDYFD